MALKKYRIQYRTRPWEKTWENSPHEFDTLEDAKAFYEKQPIKCDVRIVEAYVQVRYKPVREDLYK